MIFSNRLIIIIFDIGAMQQDPQTEDNHTVWMENAGFLYDRLFVHKLKWPSLTFQWLPYKQQSSTQITYQCIYATHSSGNAPSEHINIAQVTFPSPRALHEEPNQIPASRIKTIYKFTHENQMNRVRYCHNDSSFIAGRADQGPVSIFRYGQQYPIHLLDSNLNGGFALQWSEVGILSGDFNGIAYYWNDIQQRNQHYSFGSNIQDIKIVENNVAAFVGDLGLLSFWDLRMNSIVQEASVKLNQKKQLYSLSVNPIQKQLVITGGQDQSIRIWDRRNLSAQLHRFQGHQGSVMSVQWSKTNPSIFASGSLDKKVKIWDLMRVGFEIPKDLGGTDQLLFTHEGHKGAVNDIGWNQHEMMLGSTEQDENTVQFYKMTSNIHELEYAEDMDYLRQQCFS